MISRDELYIYYGTAYKKMTKALLEQCDLAALIGDRNSRIAIKPNLLGQVLPEEGGTTHMEVVAGLIEYLKEHGFVSLTVMESSWVGDRTADTIRYIGYDRMLEGYGVPFVDLQKDGARAVDCAGMSLNICKKALDVDFMINVPVLKGHCQTKITCALKNMKGVIPGSEKRRFHRMGLHEPIGHLSAGIRQDFILVDSICGDLTFEDGGNPVVQNRVAAALDPVLVDAWGCGVIGITPEEVPYIGIAESLGVGCADVKKARILVMKEEEEGGKNVYRQADPKEAEGRAEGGYRDVMKLKEMADAVDSCSACYAYLIPALDMLSQEGLLDRLDTKVCIGQGYRGKTGKLGVGNCTRLFENTLAGCPPTENQMADFLREYIQRQHHE